jgi:hypothetical protein
MACFVTGLKLDKIECKKMFLVLLSSRILPANPRNSPALCLKCWVLIEPSLEKFNLVPESHGVVFIVEFFRVLRLVQE